MISPDCSARCVVRDTRAGSGDRFLWTVAVLGQLDPVAEGRAKNRAEARSLAESAVAAYFANGSSRLAVGVRAMASAALLACAR